jgi:hypothetical protein
MKRIKIMGLIAVLALALSATAAASASASFFSFQKYPPAVSMGAQYLLLTFPGGGTATCPATQLSGSTSAATEALTTTVPASSNTCSGWLGTGTLTVNSCARLTFHPGESAGSFDLGPAGCVPMNFSTGHCKFAFVATTGMKAEYINQSTTPSTVSINADGFLNAERVEGSLSECGGAVTSVRFTQSWGVFATFAGSQMNVRVTPRPNDGLFLAGKESGEKAAQPRIEAESYPAKVAGAQAAGTKHVLTVAGGRKIECAKVSSTGELAASSAALDLNTTYSECTSILAGVNVGATVNMHSCHYTLGVLNAGPPYAGSLGIACSKEGDSIQIDVYKEGKPPLEANRLCSYAVGPQAGLKSVSLTNTGSDTERGISAAFSLTGLTYTRTFGTIPNCGAASFTATYSGTTNLVASS